MLDFVGFDFNRKFAPETVGFFDIYIHGDLNLLDKHTAIAGINRVQRRNLGNLIESETTVVSDFLGRAEPCTRC
jgi:hypothetical protein